MSASSSAHGSQTRHGAFSLTSASWTSAWCAGADSHRGVTVRGCPGCRYLIIIKKESFRFPSGSECGIYNLPVLNRLRPGDELYITEGCSDCWAMLSAGHKAIAIPSATLLSKKDVELLKGLNSSPFGEVGRGLSFHMYPDRDAPGERLFLQLQQVLPSLQHHQLPPGCKDFAEYYMRT